MSQDQGELTVLFARWRAGDARAADEAVARVYAELRQLARGYMRNSGSVTLQPTALVNEALIKLLGPGAGDWDNRAHFFGAAARAMRQILVDQARRRKADKRGGGELALALELGPEPAQADAVDLIALDALLGQLERLDPTQARIVELRYFVGLSIQDTGRVLDLHPSAVNREWAMARAFLKRGLSGEGGAL